MAGTVLAKLGAGHPRFECREWEPKYLGNHQHRLEAGFRNWELTHILGCRMLVSTRKLSKLPPVF